ncbi:hypothetical protein [Nocardia sp. CDC160]|uniref:hypothetical protein n=1 Tax=Nocardia sp. CDC160 TaxID=3112166 RepID=UPI002DBB1A11|nr:hypothetical protein [Nocardia sp. CDC160]MEC3916472.1 hypothetical protein [Nocardia sp. CDC160]
MVKPDSALRRLMRETGKLLEPYGFEGAEPTWVCVTEEGIARLERTRIFRTFTAGQQVLSFGLTATGTPVAWWEFCNWRRERAGLSPMAIEAATGPGLLAGEGVPDDPAQLWTIRLDPYQPGHVIPRDVTEIRTELPRRVHAAARRALRLADPETYLEELLAQPNPRRNALEAIVVLLAERGPSPELDGALDNLLRDVGDQPCDVVDYMSARTLSSRSA